MSPLKFEPGRKGMDGREPASGVASTCVGGDPADEQETFPAGVHVSSPLPAVGPVAPQPAPSPAPTSAPGGFSDALSAALEEAAPGPMARGRSTTAPATVPLARMLAVLGAAGRVTPLAPRPVGFDSGVAAGPRSAAESATGVTGIVEQATRYLGVPYRWGGSEPATGLDCSGLVQQVFDDLGVSVPRTSAEQSTVGAPVASLADARPGDLVFWASSRPGQSNHIGIYVGDGQMLHAPYTGEVVKIAPLRSAPPSAIRRIGTA